MSTCGTYPGALGRRTVIAQKSGDAFDAKSGFGIWDNEMPEAGQGPAVGSATFQGLTFSNNFQNIKNTTTTFTLTIS